MKSMHSTEHIRSASGCLTFLPRSSRSDCGATESGHRLRRMLEMQRVLHRAHLSDGIGEAHVGPGAGDHAGHVAGMLVNGVGRSNRQVPEPRSALPRRDT